MRRILFAWEMGHNFGHAAKIAPIARRLSPDMDVWVAARDMTAFRQIAPDLKCRLIPAPYAPTETTPRATYGYPGAIQSEGWGTQSQLNMQVQAWDAMFDAIQPDILVAQAAPTALLASRAQSIKRPSLKRVVLGSGYDTPILSDPMPSFDVKTQSDPETLRKAAAQERDTLHTANVALETIGAAKAPRLCDVLAPDLSLLVAWPETDHFAAQRKTSNAVYLGQMPGPNIGKHMNWAGRDRPKILAYLRPGSNIAQIGYDALSLLAAQHDIICAAPGLPAQNVKTLQQAGLQIHNGPVCLPPLLDGTDLILSLGGSGLVADGLRHGIRQVLLPTTREQMLVATQMARQGLAVGLAGTYTAQKVAEVTQALLQDKDELARVSACAKSLAIRFAESPDLTAVRCLRHL
ncbi:MAG: glycosyltransferase [Paracoccaceae bacterium]